MSGHLLATTNPEAVDQIGGEPATPPDIGAMVVYIARPGEGRAGKSEFPAIVMHHETHGGLSLMVIYDVDDMCIRPQVREHSEDTPFPAWRHTKHAEPEKFDPTRLNIIRKDLDGVRVALDETREGLYGGYEAPDGSLMDFLVSFEAKLHAFDVRLKAIEKEM